MKNHVFIGITKGWEHKRELILIDADLCTKEEAWAQFTPIKQEVLKNNHWVPYTFYEYDGQVYYKVGYLGIYDADHIPFMSNIA